MPVDFRAYIHVKQKKGKNLVWKLDSIYNFHSCKLLMEMCLLAIKSQVITSYLPLDTNEILRFSVEIITAKDTLNFH